MENKEIENNNPYVESIVSVKKNMTLLIHREIKRMKTRKIELLVLIGVPLLFLVLSTIFGFIYFDGIGKSHNI
jgi:hypothetical protein